MLMDSHIIFKNSNSKGMRVQILWQDSVFKGKSFKEGQKLAKIGQYLTLFDRKSLNCKGKKYWLKVMESYSIWVWIWNSFLTNGVTMMDFVT